MMNHGKRAGVAIRPRKLHVSDMGISKKNTRLQATVSKHERAAILKIAEKEDRSESYIVSRIVREWLREKNLIPRP